MTERKETRSPTPRRVWQGLGLAALAAAMPQAWALTASTSGAFAYDVYDTVINDILLGPIGFVAASLHVKRLW